MVVVAAGEVNYYKSCSAVLSCLRGAQHLKYKMQHNNIYIPTTSQLLSLMSDTVQKLGHPPIIFVLPSFAFTPSAENILIQHFTL